MPKLMHDGQGGDGQREDETCGNAMLVSWCSGGEGGERSEKREARSEPASWRTGLNSGPLAETPVK